MDRGLSFLFDYNIVNINTYSSPSEARRGPEPEQSQLEDSNGALTDSFGYLAQRNTNANAGIDNQSLEIVSKFSSQGDKRNIRFINYRGQRWNRQIFKPYAVERTNNEPVVDQDDTSIDELVKWSRDVPMSRLDYKDFVYCKHLGKYSNNRMVILRRFPGPITNQVFGQNLGENYEPISTIVSWVDPEDDEMFSITFNENWKVKDESLNLWTVIEEILSKIGADKIMPAMGGHWHSPLVKTLNVEVMKALGITGLDVGDYYGNPNIIRTAAWRDPQSDGFNTDVNIEVTAEYVLRYINGIDPNVAMLDIIANIVRMGSREAVWQINAGFGQGAVNIINKLFNGDSEGAVRAIIAAVIKALKTLLDVVIRFIVDAAREVANLAKNPREVGAAAAELAYKLAGVYLKGMLAEHRYKLLAAISGSTGSPSGIWHVMIGNPKKPVVAIGDMVCSNVKLSVNNKLGFDDWPTEIKAVFTMVNARNMGAQDIESIFNAGQQRIYYKGFYSPTKEVTVTSNNSSPGDTQQTVRVSTYAFENIVDNGPDFSSIAP